MEAVITTKLIHSWLRKYNRGEVTFSPELIQEYTNNVQERIGKERNKKFTLRMSNLGRPVCQLQNDKLGTPRISTNEYQRMYTFMAGDMGELWLIMVMKAAGVAVDDYNVPVELLIGGEKIKGTADIIIDGILWDIKTMSSKSYQKYINFGGFKSLEEDDPFGYVEQGFAYAEGLGLPFGGWIILNKNTGDIAISEVPINYDKYKSESLARSAKTIQIVMDTVTADDVQRQFSPIEETFNKKPTGNMILPVTCGWCEYTESCWPNAEYRKSAVSSAKTPPWFYYTEVNYEKDSTPTFK